MVDYTKKYPYNCQHQILRLLHSGSYLQSRRTKNPTTTLVQKILETEHVEVKSQSLPKFPSLPLNITPINRTEPNHETEIAQLPKLHNALSNPSTPSLSLNAPSVRFTYFSPFWIMPSNSWAGSRWEHPGRWRIRHSRLFPQLSEGVLLGVGDNLLSNNIQL